MFAMFCCSAKSPAVYDAWQRRARHRHQPLPQRADRRGVGDPRHDDHDGAARRGLTEGGTDIVSSLSYNAEPCPRAEVGARFEGSFGAELPQTLVRNSVLTKRVVVIHFPIV